MLCLWQLTNWMRRLFAVTERKSQLCEKSEGVLWPIARIRLTYRRVTFIPVRWGLQKSFCFWVTIIQSGKKMLRAYANRASWRRIFSKGNFHDIFPDILDILWDFSEDLVYHPRTTRIILASYLITYFYILKIYPKPQRRIRSANTFVLLLWKNSWAHSTFVLPWRGYGLRSVNNKTKSLI